MKLSKIQREFTKCIGAFIFYASSKGYGLTFGDSFRDKRVHGKFGEKKSYSSAYSCHKVRLAVDFNLFIGDKYVVNGNHPIWEELGNHWKSLHPLARWGGDFKIKDSNHLSFEYQGYK